MSENETQADQNGPSKEGPSELTDLIETELAEDRVYPFLRRNEPDPRFYLNPEDKSFVDINRAFEELTGYSREQLLDGSIRMEDVFVPESTNILEKVKNSSEDLEDQQLELQCMVREGQTIPVRVTISSVSLNQHRLLICAARDISEQKEMRQTLRQQLNEAMKSNNRILALTEKIKHVPVLISSLLNLDNEEELFKEASERLCERTGLNYSNITFYLTGEDETLECVYSTRSDVDERIEIDSDTPIGRVASGEDNIIRSEPDVFLLPLHGEEETIGVIRVTLDAKERELMEGNESAWAGYQEMLVTLGNLLGLILQNRRLYEKVRLQSIHDGLTDVYNRRHFNRTLKKEVNRARRYDHPLSLLIIDINDFKEINDTYGHQEGDNVLKEMAAMLSETSRDADILCRYGGDEFVLILPETRSENAVQKARMILEAFEERSFTVSLTSGESEKIQIEISIGVSFLPEEGGEDVSEELIESFDEEELLRTADQCMYEAKISDDKNLVVHEHSSS